MSNLPKFGEYAAAFEQSLVDDDWTRLEIYFAENASYKPGDGTEGTGRIGAVEMLKQSVDLLERKCDVRELLGQPEITESGDTITLKYAIKYVKHGTGEWVLEGVETIRYQDGLIVAMEDVFENADEVLQWRAAL